MDNLARIKPYDNIVQVYGVVKKVVQHGYLVETKDTTCRARQAASCLLKPQVNDRVLLIRSGEESGFILAILERDSRAGNTLEFNSEVHLKVKQGRLKVTSQEGMDIASAKDIKTVSEKMSMNAIKGRFGIHDVLFQGAVLNAQIDKVKWLAERVEMVVNRLFQRTRRSYRSIDEFEQVRAGRVDYLVKKLLSFRSKYTILTSKEDIKVDGERIHIG